MVPHFDLQGGLLLSAVRAVSVTALLSVFGTLVFRVVVAPKAFARMSTAEMVAGKRRLLMLTQGSTLAGLIGNVLWLAVQSADMADTDSLSQLPAALPEVLTTTLFGHVILAQSLCLAVSAVVVGLHDREWRQRGGLLLASVALCLQAGHSHSWSMYDGPSLLLACDVLHLVGAGAWLGGLVPLLLMVQGASPRAGATAARWFSPLGQWCIAALVVSAAYQAWVLIATIPGVIGTAYGWMALAKFALLAALLGFAAINRYRFAPALIGGDAAATRRVLVRSITLQTGVAVAIVVAAGVLSELPPSMHEQPLWPFAQRFSLDAVSEDPDFRAEVLWACAALAGAALVVALAFMLRRWRWPASGAAAIVAWFALPHLDLLLVPAYPTSFYHSPTGFSSASIVQGQKVYAQNCVACHGADGRGDHPMAASMAGAAMPVPPADLTAEHLWMHSDGELFWWVAQGIATPEGAQAMPGFGATLDDDQRWAVIDYIRAHNAGTAMQANGDWPHTMQAPGFGAACGTANIKSADLRGHFVQLRFAGKADAPAAGDAITVLAGLPAASAPAGVCVTGDETVPLAYEIVSGLDDMRLAGTTFLIDDSGWLRAMQQAGAAPSWSNQAALTAEIGSLRAHKVNQDAGAPMKMPM